ncbi:MAG: hypothetical protein JW746_03645 [Candidatus Krumholzibacteriota bacterium]|nr:hypothetical protein [Candidatus Krumholzibacteriota bacterium]
MQLRRSVLLALLIILFVYFEIHSCSRENSLAPEPPPSIPSLLLNATDIFFLNKDCGWVCGQSGTMIMTVDGGESWDAVDIGDVNLSSISFIDPNIGWVVGRYGSIYKSTDRGATWSRQLFYGVPEDDDLFQVVFRSEQDGFIQGFHGVFVSNTGGADWENYWLAVEPSRGAWSMSMIDDKNGYLLGSHWTDADPELLYRTYDGGFSWSEVEGSEASILTSILEIEFIDCETGWAGGGTIMKTVDGGKTWEMQLEETTVREFSFLDSDTGFAAGGETILRTTDGGCTWIDITPDDERIADLRAVQFIDKLTGWVVGRGREELVGEDYYKFSIVMKTVDGGDSWTLTRFGYDLGPLGQTEEVE